MGRRRREEGEISVCEGLGERWHERKGVAGWGRWRQIESRARRDCPGEQRRAAVLHGENHDTATIRITNQRLAVEKVDGISQRRRIPRRLVVDVDVVVPDATRESPSPSSTTWIFIYVKTHGIWSHRPVWRRRILWRRFPSVCVRGEVFLSGMIGWKMSIVVREEIFFFLTNKRRINYLSKVFTCLLSVKCNV